MENDLALQQAIYSSLKSQRSCNQPCQSRSIPVNRQTTGSQPRNGLRNALLREGIMPTVPRSAQTGILAPVAVSQYRFSPPRTECVGSTEENSNLSGSPIIIHPQRVSDRVPGWTQMCTGGRIQRQNTLGSQLVFIGTEAHLEQTPKISCSDLLLLRAVAPLPNDQSMSCFTAQVQSLVSPGHYAMFGMGVTPNAGEELHGFPLVLIHFDASGAAFISVERWHMTENDTFERLVVLEPMKALRLIRDRVTLSLVITSQCMSVHINGELLYPMIVAENVRLGEALPILLSTGGKILIRDVTVTEGDKPPVNNRLYGRPSSLTVSPKKSDAIKKSQTNLEDRHSPGGVRTSRSENRVPPTTKRPTMTRHHNNTSTVKEEKGRSGGDNLPSGINADFADRIESEIIERSPNVQWEDIAGIPDAKRLLKEAVILPLLVPELFTGVVQPWKGVLLFGPPGTGKTMLARAVATSAKTTFFNISASTLISRYFGESEKMVRTLFQLARHYAPSTIFFDEVDALMSSRGGNEHEASRRVKSEMLQQIDGLSTESDRRVMVLATTNRPWDLDEAMRRRLEKRIYIPLPDVEGRMELLKKQTSSMSMDPSVDLEIIAKEKTVGFSGADLNLLVRDAAMTPMRKLIADRTPAEIAAMKEGGKMILPAVTMQDFEEAVKKIQPSVSQQSLKQFERWSEELGSV
ncbi:katanin, putative [Trypanosoma cruzi marinkellei]|uniref:Katanin p60 ATPase-containing subunit A1 n=1 Tax=Trypanosoma cruzi marinkellei TaxID=85056 RepID=K2MS73_TRYCR|nr:katanin, putative [Trypanosoma cruzi marinkellei]